MSDSPSRLGVGGQAPNPRLKFLDAQGSIRSTNEGTAHSSRPLDLQTLLKVAKSICEFQRGFLDKGMPYLRPLVLKDVAEDIGMHESTVSRVTTNKYIHTPQGVFELKFFFHSGLDSFGGSAMSSVTVKDIIRKAVLAEDSHRPLTDQQLVGLLEDKGIKIARRTVAKYRQELRIAPANRRKRLF